MGSSSTKVADRIIKRDDFSPLQCTDDRITRSSPNIDGGKSFDGVELKSTCHFDHIHKWNSSPIMHSRNEDKWVAYIDSLLGLGVGYLSSLGDCYILRVPTGI
ncbi:hypothetical protein AVEN_222612-1 [Araneus ventricosus]|uniref:Uncharacterized protein n=1 Tax=Araneus ventricosus TaxID=182803 RepID=A0A4Y2WZF6_ARAVE|nr:hypothetical protein AVEN_173415-1 [Araneus ventricosus]GBO42044.1 hypothetical protein AVEN_222612-1 [Araneus ventricosus]